MTVSTEGERTRRRRIRRHDAARIAIFFFWVIFVLSQLRLSSGKHDNSGPSGRRARFFETASFHAVSTPSSSAGTADEGSDELYGEDKRIVHTGPNPLHN